MRGATWPDPLTTISQRTGESVLARLWPDAKRIEAVLTDANRLLLPLRAGNSAGPETVDVLTSTAAALPLPTAWSWRVLSYVAGPEFILFYPIGSSFPSGALIFSGSEAEAWATFHRRPIVLNRLRQRFAELARTPPVSPAAAVAAVREDGSAPGRLDVARAGGQLLKPDQVTLAELYRRVLTAHFAGFDHAPNDQSRLAAAPGLATHQERAFERACNIIDRFGGVIVADAVGLGKTYVGLRLIERALEAAGRVLVIVPASLRSQWERELLYLRQTCAPGAETNPRAERGPVTLDLWVRESRALDIRVLSTESLGRRSFDAGRHADAALVLVDEAHHFRNPLTRRYRALSDLTRYSKVVLLTATPINNTLFDLQHLIALFAAPGAFRHLGVSDYREVFRRAAAGEGDVRPIIAACVLRRTRRFLRTHYGKIQVYDREHAAAVELRFPHRAPPQPVAYDLAGTYGDLFAQLESWLDGLHFATFQRSKSLQCRRAASVGDVEPDSDDCEPNRAGAALASSDLLKIILLKRLESSVEAFRRTVIQQVAWCDTALRAAAAGRLLSRPDYRASFRGPRDDPGSQLALFELMLPDPALDPADLALLRQQLSHDRELLASVHRSLASSGPESDHKLRRLRALLDGPLADRKVLIFTEFRDTARYLHHQLAGRPFLAQVDSGGARLGRDRASRRAVIRRFAPRSNGLADPPHRERVDLLIATDVLSEGLNLQDASTVVSYDLPWNPVRLMQRIGRIDRLGALADVVELYHFLPASHLERLLGLMERLQAKVSTIGKTLGLDRPVLAPDTESADLQRLRSFASDPSELDRLEAEAEGPLDPEEQAYLDFVAAGAEHNPDPSSRPVIAATTCRDLNSAHVVSYWRLVVGHAARALWLIYRCSDGNIREDQASAIGLLRNADRAEKPDTAWQQLALARHACADHAAKTLGLLHASCIAGDALSPTLPQCRIAAWLSRKFQASAHRLTTEQRLAIDRALDRLTRRLTPAGERELARLAEALPEDIEEGFLERLESTLLGLDGRGEGLIAMLEIATLLLLPDPAQADARNVSPAQAP